ncbi:MAG: hypothetical protein PVH88_12105 [Ignavibacteria bacterium]|jgi:hypothetical protein
MKPYIFIYCEGSENKIVVFNKDKNGIKLLKTVSVKSTSALAGTEAEHVSDFNLEGMGEDISFDKLDSGDFSSVATQDSDVSGINNALFDVKLSQSQFIPVITEPTANYHIYDGQIEEDKNKLIEAILKDIQETKGFYVSNDLIDCTRLNDNGVLSVFVEGEIACVGMINSLAVLNGRRYYKIPTIKSAEISLAYYVSKTTKFYPEDYSLIIYTGKEYSKLIFLEGQRLKHIGTTLDIGTQNLHTYDVYFSKILLEMENGGIPRLDNVILCGEDRSENLVLSFYGTFPEANVNELSFDAIDKSLLNEEDEKELSGFSIPIASAVDFFDELENTHKGINILPKYIQENQKFLQFGWHSYAILPLLFAATFYFTVQVLFNNKELNELDGEINRLKNLQQQNMEIIDQITPLDIKIKNFSQTQAILDSATVGTEVWGNLLDKVSSFVERRRNFWVSKVETIDNGQVKFIGYTLSRRSITEFARDNNSSTLDRILYEPLRDNSAFAYEVTFPVNQETNNIE